MLNAPHHLLQVFPGRPITFRTYFLDAPPPPAGFPRTPHQVRQVSGRPPFLPTERLPKVASLLVLSCYPGSGKARCIRMIPPCGPQVPSNRLNCRLEIVSGVGLTEYQHRPAS
jgi:hypothetical protein